ncbi:glycosyltransferase [Neobacillus kokaensis]|uniref:Glycosyl transferase family 1 domain-containing protein n=1 Tax=Neobacillus kokaensis TaxID=2759023 RepID=A0ABQ3N166_9BACI|nr:glycosyltransferase [Neobacillus kokaensis]GHH98663.1 hypothetical protein AM1BK_22060 [Neobacillus kokaensis]
MKKIIFVNATSLSTGGGLTILNNYINQVNSKKNSNELYYFFIPDNVIKVNKNSNIIYIKNSENEYYKNKHYWNSLGMKRWSINNKIKPDEMFSMQNYFPFGFKKDNIFKSVYIHQSIPFFPYKWSFCRKDERKLWFYKYIYIYLIKKSVKNADKIIVQTKWFRNQIMNKFNISKEKFVIERPDIPKVLPDNNDQIFFREGFKSLFYPASSDLYKNHEVLIKAMNIIVNILGKRDVLLYLTINKNDYRINTMISRYNLEENIILTGVLNYQQVLGLYKKIDLLVFPSKVETFGLPLLEVQQFGLPIIAGDLNLYKEVIGEYSSKVIYCPLDDEQAWADSIKEILDESFVFN